MIHYCCLRRLAASILPVCTCTSLGGRHIQIKSVKKTRLEGAPLTALQIQHLPSSPSASKTWQNNIDSRASHPLVFHPKRLQYCSRIQTTPADEKPSTKSLCSSILEFSIRSLSRLPSPFPPFPSHLLPITPLPSHLTSPFPKRLSSRNLPRKIKMPARKRISEFFAPMV